MTQSPSASGWHPQDARHRRLQRLAQFLLAQVGEAGQGLGQEEYGLDREALDLLRKGVSASKLVVRV